MPYLIFPPLFLSDAYSFLEPSTSQAMRSVWLGIALAAYPLGQFIGSPLLGSLSDQYGRRKLLALSLLVCSVATLATALSLIWGSLYLLVFSRFIAGLMEGNIAIARAMAIDLKSIPKARSLGMVNVASSSSFLVGPFLGAFLSNYALPLPFFVISALFFLLTFMAFYFLSRIETEAAPRDLNPFGRIKELFANKQLRWMLTTITLFTLAVDIFYEFAPVHLTLKWALTPTGLALYSSPICLGLIIGNGYLGSRLKKGPVLLLSMATFVIVMIQVAYLNVGWMIFSLFALAGAAIGVTVTLLTVRISNAASEQEQGAVMGVQQSLRVLGDAIICLFGGALLILSSKWVLLLAAAIALSALLYFRKRARLAALDTERLEG